MVPLTAKDPRVSKRSFGISNLRSRRLLARSVPVNGSWVPGSMPGERSEQREQ
jgi:hypothetical protein